MKTLKPFIFFFLYSIAGLTQPSTNTDNTDISRHSDSATSYKNINYIIFGFYCGMCAGHYATMYQYNTIGDSNTLLMDTTDSFYFAKGVTCKMAINDSEKLKLAGSIVNKIPGEFFTNKDTLSIYGHPESGDRGGIYFEMFLNGEKKKFYLDVKLDELPEPVRYFVEYVKTLTFSLDKSFNL